MVKTPMTSLNHNKNSVTVKTVMTSLNHNKDLLMVKTPMTSLNHERDLLMVKTPMTSSIIKETVSEGTLATSFKCKPELLKVKT